MKKSELPKIRSMRCESYQRYAAISEPTIRPYRYDFLKLYGFEAEKYGTFRSRLAFYLDKKNLSTVQFADQCNMIGWKYGIKMNPHSFYEYIYGTAKPKSTRLALIAVTMGVTVEWLLGAVPRNQTRTGHSGYELLDIE